MIEVMNMHVVACEMHSWCSGGHLNGLGVLYLLATVGGIAAVVVIGTLLALKAGWQPKPARAAQPLWQAYTFPVQALTPRGTLVRMSCCRKGHATPDAARAHADAVAERIRRTGR